GFKEKGKSKALVADSEKMDAKRVFKSKETVESNSNEEEEEERVCIIKKIKCKYVEESTGARKWIGVAELQVTVVPKTPVAGPSCLISKPAVLILSMPKSVPKAPVVSTTPIAGLSTMQSTVPSSALRTISATPAPKPMPVTSTVKPAIKGASVH
ncbi:hypothetical protein C0995_000423, partial [Termitomyces sp. Mi166